MEKKKFKKIQGEVFDRLYKIANAFLSSGTNVIIDSTNIKKVDRIRLINKLSKNADEFIAVVVDVDVATCKERNAKRERKVPNEVIDRMAQQFTHPTYDEGWNSIIFQKNI